MNMEQSSNEDSISSSATRDNSKAYSEACNTLRHYSLLSFNVRNLTVIQGVILLGVWIGGYPTMGPKALVSISLLGCGFTYLLFRFYKGYYIATNFLYNAISKMEEKLFDEDFRPFLGYRNDHDIRYGIPFNRFSILYAPFLVIGIPFILTLAISLVKLYNALKC